MESYVAFAGDDRLAQGEAAIVTTTAAAALRGGASMSVLFFEMASGRQVDFDLRGTDEEIIARLGELQQVVEARGVGRPKLGVEAHEVTLLPRHWEWLREQPGGASVALRKLVEEARKVNVEKDQARAAQDATARFAGAMAGNRSGFEEAMRALYAGDEIRFKAMIMHWPEDVQSTAWRMAEHAFATRVEA